MHEFNPGGDVPADQQAARLYEQVAQLAKQEICIGSEPEGAEGNYANVLGDAHDPTAIIDTSMIGSEEEVDEETAVERPPVIDTTAEPSNEANEFNEFGDTTITATEILDKYDRWQAGEVVESGSTPIARLEVSEEDWAALSSIDGDFRTLHKHDLKHPEDEHSQQVTGLSANQLRIINSLDRQFGAAVAADAARNGLDKSGQLPHLVEVGRFGDDPTDTLGWHTDRFHRPSARYVLSFGPAGSTRFAHGPSQKDQTDDIGDITNRAYVNTRPGGTHQEVTYPTGVIVRFLANCDWHASPVNTDFRIFFTTSVPVPHYQYR